jgi:AP-4 complex subunit epsilon-1
MKRIGYLCCCLFLNENSEVLILLVANLQRDLQSTNVHEIVIALTALAKLINATIVTALLDQVTKLLTHTTDLVRKKAIMVLQKIYRLNQTYVQDYEEKLHRALCDKEPSVMGATLNLYLEQIKENASIYKEKTGSFVLILK